MVTLHVSQSRLDDDRHRVLLRVDGDGGVVREAVSEFRWAVDAVDAERVRWYLEDFLEYPLDPAPRIASDVEGRLAQLGRQLFEAVFAGRDAQFLWARVQERLPHLRVEIASEVDEAATLPWELLRDPATDMPLALQAASFVRVNLRAEHWYRRALDLTAEHDHRRRAAGIAQLGRVARERFLDAGRAGEPEHVLRAHLNDAAQAYHQALDLTHTHTDRATFHNQLGNIYADAGQLDTALHHYQQAIRHHEDSEDRYRAGRTRFNVALTLAQAGRTGEALLYAQAALRDFEPYGPSAATDIDKARSLITMIKRGDFGPSS